MKINKTNKKFYHIWYDKILVKIDFGFWFMARINTKPEPETETETQNGISLRTRCLFSKYGRKWKLCG